MSTLIGSGYTLIRRLFETSPLPELDEFNDQLLTGWGRTASSLAHVVRPSSAGMVKTFLEQADRRGAIARGLGRSYGDPAQNAGGVVLDMTSLQSVHEFDIQQGTIKVDAGLSLSRTADMILPFGFFLPVTPGTQHVTVGGAIACDVHGKNHHSDGSFGEHVLALELLTPTGDRLHLSPDCMPDVFWATVGGVGLTGVILNATLRLPRVETARFNVDTDRTSNLDEVMSLQESEDDRYRYSVAWVDCLATGKSLGRSILMRGNYASYDELPSKQRRQPLARKNVPELPSPPWAPSGLLRPASVKILNEAWYRKAPKRERGTIQSIDAFFYPLDVLSGWNRFYGSEGFVQYQFVVPSSQANVVKVIVERLAAGKWPTSLAVLKRMSGGHGDMSFAIPGWTLAVDLPAGISGISELLDSLDDIVVGAGGRVYLAKDSRMRPEVVEAMYPEIRRWRETLSRIDPERTMQSDLARRLQLREQG